jgi:hypothetical protein
VGNRKVMTAQWGDAYDWAFDGGVTEVGLE